MAIPLRQLIPLRQIRLRRLELGRYIALDNGRAYIAVAVLCALMGIAIVVQTSRVAQIGKELDDMHGAKKELEHLQKNLELRIAKAQSVQRIVRYADNSGMIQVRPKDVEYLTINTSDMPFVNREEVTP